ncbi:MAG: CapA family protein, partial [Coriobacteriia bacterium]|nr:CapA family protein [Coriobacteriia bacterium]
MFVSILMTLTLLAFPACIRLEDKIITSDPGFQINPSVESTFTPRSPDDEPLQRALISFAGDCVFSNAQGSSMFNRVYDREGPAYFLSNVVDVFANDDLTIVNLEVPLTTSPYRVDKGEEYDENGRMVAFWFRAPPDYVDILTSSSIEVCNLANNHMNDYGSQGYAETMQVLSNAGIDYFGWENTVVRDVNGIKIGFFGFAFNSNGDTIKAAMDQLRADGAEVIVGYFHDGIELDRYPSGSQRAAAYAAIDYGASAVLMSHVHIVQGVENYKDGFIAWSMGNFCVGQYNNF